MKPPVWMRWTLALAALYNIAWGAFAIVFPMAYFRLAGMPDPLYPQLWQCIGMIVGVYGVGYAIAACNPYRHWPIVLVGLLGKIFGPIGFAVAVYEGVFPLAAAWTIITNDLIWWVPFSLILYGAFQDYVADEGEALPLARAAEQACDQHGVSLAERSRQAPQLVVFLRHAGCTFCREALADLAEKRDAIRTNGVELVLVHMGEDASMERMASGYDLGDAARIADPGRELYRSFGLRRGSLSRLLGPRVWKRGYQAAIIDKHGVGALEGDGFQMPGVFLFQNSEIVHAFHHETSADRPDYESVAACAIH